MKQSPYFFGWLVFCAVAGAGGIGWLRELRVAAGREAVALAQKNAEYERLGRADSDADGWNERATANDVAVGERRLAALRAALQTQPGRLPPERSIDAYFEIAGFIDRMRVLAARHQVAIRPDEHFGFAAFANHGPEVALVPAVGHQMQAVQELLGILFAARPGELLAVQRERPRAAASRAARAPGIAVVPAQDGPAADYFSPELRLRQSVPGLADPILVRLEFTGQTPVLRDFLNGVAASRLLLIVRGVEVEPMSASPASAAPGARATGTTAPLVAQNPSTFSVVVEDARLGNSEGISGP